MGLGGDRGDLRLIAMKLLCNVELGLVRLELLMLALECPVLPCPIRVAMPNQDKLVTSNPLR